ncbi:MAG: CoA ester lyase [Sandaracinus sp.]|nr:CoA ester lyase [Sandaracinus sp.]|tara:strand:- start:1625 stop:2455 length:831 start_codon:yes stop_codon:yes gene_type:complete
MPGSNARALEKGRTLDADGLILDLEDAVSPAQKAEARTQVVAALTEGGYGHREILLRVNGLETAWGEDDLRAAATAGAHGVLLPKVESAETVLRAQQVLEGAGAPADLELWCMMETPRGILRAEAIADSSPKLRGFVMGTSDLAKDLHAAHTAMRLPMLVGLGTCLLAARAAGLAILDGVYLDLNDEDGFRASCVQGAELGFDGKTLIHPKQLAAANEVFAPSEDAVTFSRRVIEAHAAAEAEGKGVVLVDGKLVENLHVEAAHRLVALADAIAAR